MTWSLLPLTLPIFFVHDFFLLRMGPRSRTPKRLGAYSLILLVFVILFSVVPATSPGVNSASSSLFIVLMVCFYAGLSAASIWAKRTDRHNFGWLIAAAPNPLLALGMTKVVQTLALDFPGASQASALAAACLWSALMALCVKRADDAPMTVPDLDFSLTIAAVVNSAALLTLVI